MTEAVLRYVLEVKADDLDKLRKDVDSTNKAIGDGTEQASSKGASGLGKLAKAGILAGGAAGLGALFATAKMGWADFSEGQKVTAQTEAALKSTGGAANVTAKHINTLAGSLQRKTGMDDEAIQSASNLILTFTKVRNEVGKGNDIFDLATKAALDLSQAGFGSLESTSKQLGKALNDPIKGMAALGKSGVLFTASQKETIKALVESGDLLGAQKLILAEVNTQVGGSAEAYGKTLPGQIAIAKGAFENFAGSLVEKAIPVIQQLVGWIKENIVPAIQDFAAKMREHGPTFRKMWEDLQPVLKMVGQLITNVVAPALEFLFFEVLPRAIPILVGLISWWVKILTTIIDVVKGIVGAVTDAWNTIRDVTEAVWGVIGGVVTKYIDVITTVITTYVAIWRAIIETAWKVIQAVTTTVWGAISGAVTAAWDAISAIVTTAVAAVKAIITGAWDAILAATNAVWDAIRAALDLYWTLLSGMITGYVKVWLTIIETAWNAIKAVTEAVWNAISALLDTVWKAISAIVTTTVATVQSVITAAWNALKSLSDTVWNAISGLFTSVFNAIEEVVKRVVAAVESTITAAWNAIKDLSDTVWNAISSLFTTVFEAIEKVVKAVVAAVEKVITDAWNTLKSLTETTWNAISGAVDTAVNAVKKVVETVIGALVGYISGKWDDIKADATRIWGLIQTTIEGVVDGISTYVEGVIDGIVTFFTEMPGRIAAAIKAGAAAAKDLVLDAIKEIFSLLPEKVKGWLGISSPSTVFEDIGRNIVLGLIEGLKGAAPDLRLHLESLFNQRLIRLPGPAGLIPVDIQAPGMGAPYVWMTQYAQSQGWNVSSGLRGPRFPGDKSFHISGKAIDITGGDMKGIFHKILADYGASSILELFHDPVGFSIDNYNVTSWLPGDHYDHVHWAMRKGGIFTAATSGWFTAGEGGAEAFIPLDDPRARKYVGGDEALLSEMRRVGDLLERRPAGPLLNIQRYEQRDPTSIEVLSSQISRRLATLG